MLKEASGDVGDVRLFTLLVLVDNRVVGVGGVNAETVVVNPIAVKIKDENFMVMMVMKIYYDGEFRTEVRM